MKIEDASPRNTIWRELHARPYVRFTGPAHVFHFTFLTGEGNEAADRERLEQLKTAMKLEPTYQTVRHAICTTHAPGLGRLVLAWERHTEYVACTFFIYELEIPFRPFELEPDAFLPAGFCESFGVQPLIATRIEIGSKNEVPDTESLRSFFEGHTLIGSRVMGGQAEAWSCYRVHADGFGRIVLIVGQMSPQDLGRTVERLLVIEDTHHLMLLSLPLARAIKPDLARWEGRLVAEMDALRVADSVDSERAVLNSLLELAADVEHVRARVFNRFSASSAYFAILRSRVKDLREQKIEHVLRVSRFLMRRLAPAARTLRNVHRRLVNLSKRIDRGADLLRTRIDLTMETQNQRLLESADRRARLQLGLQHAVEGLSIIVLTYYTLGIIGHVLHGLDELGWHVHPEITLGVAAPVVLLIFWGLTRLIRRGYEERR